MNYKKDLNYYKEEIIKYLGYFPYTIINEEEYNGGTSKLKFKCNKCGYIFERKIGDLTSKIKININNGGSYVCKQCTTKRHFDDVREKSKKEFIDKINKYFPNEFEMYDDYINEDTKIHFKCKLCNNDYYITPSNVKNCIRKNLHHMCKYCNTNNSKIKNTKSKEYFIEKLKEKNKDNYLIENYINMDKKCYFTCLNCNYKFLARPINVLNAKKYYCPNCNNKIRDNRDYKTRCLEISSNTIIPLENYINRKTAIKHKCLICNTEWCPTPNNILRGEGCPTCMKSAYTSKSEKELYTFIKSIYNRDIRCNDRGVIPPKELDIYLPDKGIAIEYCGLYWHGDRQKPNNYHLEKTNECNEKGIRLIHIFEDEWLNKKDIVKNKIRYILGESNKSRIYARKCWIKEISNEKKNIFLDKYHIQGKDNSSIRLGLYTKSPKTGKNILVSVMTFCKPRKALGQKSNTKFDYELSRFASTSNYVIIGGFSKLFKYFERNYEWSRLITYADKRWSEGNVYLKNGWIHDHDSKPSYWYIENNHGNIRYYRYNFRKSKLKELFPDIYDDNLSERQIMKKAGYYRIYDCGNMVFVYKR